MPSYNGIPRDEWIRYLKNKHRGFFESSMEVLNELSKQTIDNGHCAYKDYLKGMAYKLLRI